jgi:hypothetical protein
MSPADARMLGDVTPRTADDDPGRMVEALGKLMGKVFCQPLVLCVDQLEDVWAMDDSVDRFQRAMSAVVTLADRVPSCVIVICCLDDFYAVMSERLTRSLRDRLEKDPDPIRLKSQRSFEEILELVGRRLQHLYETQHVDVRGGPSHYPIPRGLLEARTGQRTRDVLDFCRNYREEAIRRGTLPSEPPLVDSPVPPAEPSVPPEPPVDAAHLLALQQAWNDWRSTYAEPRPDDDAAIAELLAWGIARASDELESGVQFDARSAFGTIDVEVTPSSGPSSTLRVAICNKDPRGGGLLRQIEAARKDAAGRLPVLVRSTEFPTKPGTKVAEEIGRVIAGGGRRAVIEDAELLTMLALRAFRSERGDSEEVRAFLARDNPLSRLPVLRTILALDEVEPAGSTPESYAASRRGRARAGVADEKSAAPSAPKPVSGELSLGKTEGVSPQPLTLPIDALTAHAAFLGGTGSGKTTLALGVVEQLLERGIPVILVDRKGDLVGYADHAAWTTDVRDPSQLERRRALRDRVDVAVYTPGNAAGRALSVSLVPPGMKDLAPTDREDEAAQAADALAGMLDYRTTGRDKSCRAILTRAVLLLSGMVDPLGLDTLIDFIDAQDPALLAAIGKLDVRLFDKLVQDLETFKLTNARLLDGDGERLDIAALLGKDGSVPAGKTRLTIISTKFLGDTGKTLFWVAQLLLRLSRWASQKPMPSLQAAVLFDEADLYLPAVGQPATKQPMENLLRRARSAGLGMLLATQSPGDFDYKCRDNIQTWSLGRITQSVAIHKMKPMLSECRTDVGSKLASRAVGHFFLVRAGSATPFHAGLPALLPAQRSDDEILELARRTRRS